MHPSPLRKRSDAGASHLVGGAVVNVCLLAVLVGFAWLKEQPLFWRNAGNWPIWLRELVGSSFYPLFLLEFLLLTAFTGASIRCLRSGCSGGGFLAVALPLVWGLFFVVILLLVANNLDNLLAGRPLHWHPE